jgi:hypothetical protein
MNHHDTANTVDHSLTRLKEEFGLTLSDLLETVLGLTLFIDWVMDHAILVSGEDDYFIFFD